MVKYSGVQICCGVIRLALCAVQSAQFAGGTVSSKAYANVGVICEGQLILCIVSAIRANVCCCDDHLLLVYVDLYA